MTIRITFLAALFAGLTAIFGPAFAAEPAIDPIHAAFMNPPADCRPHTRWWWMGNALSNEDIDWDLDQMQAQGIGGVEQISMEPVYEKGNHDYLSPEYFALLRHAVEGARDRGMEFSVNFGGPGWIWGGEWVPQEDQSQILLSSMLLLEGPRAFSGPLSEKATPNPDDLPRSTPVIGPDDRLIKVVAARVENGKLRQDSLVDLSALAMGRTVAWSVPEGQWQLMGFWLTQRDNHDAVDHLSQGAMTRYCETLGARYEAAIGGHFGKTVESFFSDSFEVPIQRNGLYWTDGLFETFQKDYGYDLVPWLPALWWDVDGLSPKIRHDVNKLLHEQGMRAFFKPFLDWCSAHNLKGRIQPYGFVTDVLEGAGAAHLPEMEITAGEKDAVPWFDTRVGPREHVASGAHLYGRNVVTTEAFTFLHWEPYRETLQEIKTATDAYLRAGANKLYNHGFIATPERTGLVPTRGFFEAIRISPENIWWPWYHHLAEYTARCCQLLQQGDYVADVAVYSPLANQWTQSVLNARRWTRDFDWGGLSQLLIGNGYACDLVNDDILQHQTTMDGALLRAGKMSYRVLILPDTTALPLETLQKLESYVRQGGTIIALERTPETAVGFKDYAANDAEVRRISGELFGQPAGPNDTSPRSIGQGRTFHLESVLQRIEPLDFRSAPLDPFLKTLRACVPQDLDIDLVRAGRRQNEGLAFIHRRADAMDLYFVSNFQDAAVNEIVGFRTAQGLPHTWEPMTGERRPVHAYDRVDGYTRINLSLPPFGSRFIVFEHAGDTPEPPHMIQSDFTEVLEANKEGFTARAEHNGVHAYRYFDGTNLRDGNETVTGLPAPYTVNGDWKVQFEGQDAPPEALQWPGLISWTDEPKLRHFSGHARYTVTFSLPAEYLAEATPLQLSLGRVGCVAEIKLNGQPVGVHWMDGQDFSLDGLARPGDNTLEVLVTNTLINRVAGLSEFPGVPEALQPLYGADISKHPNPADRLLGFEPLPPSGLLGPVRIIPNRDVRVVT